MLQVVAHLPGGAIRKNNDVVVQCAGALGLAALMPAKLVGARKVLLLEANVLRMQEHQGFGADANLDITTTTREERKEPIDRLMGHRGTTLAIECSGGIQAVPDGLDLLARNAKYLLLGTWAGKGEVVFDPFVVLSKATMILGSTYCASKDYYAAARSVEKYREQFPLAACVTHKFGLAGTQAGLEAVLRDKVD